MAVVVVAVAAVAGSAAGVALGVGAAIGAAIGGGLAGGLVSKSQGGSFAKGFAMGAIGGALGGGGFLEGAMGGLAAEGAGAAMAAEMGGYAAGAGDLLAGGLGAAGGAATEGALGELTSAGAEVGGLPTGNASLEGITSTGASAGVSPMAEVVTPQQSGGLQGMYGTMTDIPYETGSELLGEAGSTGFNNISGPTATPYAQMPTDVSGLGTSTGYNPYDTSFDTSMSPTTTGGSLEQVVGQPSTGNVFDTEAGYTEPGKYTSNVEGAQGQTSGLGGMLKSSDQWLAENLGIKGNPRMPGSTTMRLGTSLFDTYQGVQRANQLKDQAAQMRNQYSSILNPMSLQDYMKANYNPNAIRSAGMKMASAGRTGTIPAMQALARQKAAQGYTSTYLPQAQRAGLGASQQIADREALAAAAKQQAYGKSISTLGGLFGVM